MPRASASRVIAAEPSAVWSLVSDPYHLPRWWPRAQRVENVRPGKGGRRGQWTLVLASDRGKAVRADYRCVAAAEGKHSVWEQQIEDTPFARILHGSRTEIALEPDPAGTRVTIATAQRLRGLSRLGSPMMRRATRAQIEAALEGLAGVLEPPPPAAA